jgi:hypothetical protein
MYFLHSKFSILWRANNNARYKLRKLGRTRAVPREGELIGPAGAEDAHAKAAAGEAAPGESHVDLYVHTHTHKLYI